LGGCYQQSEEVELVTRSLACTKAHGKKEHGERYYAREQSYQWGKSIPSQAVNPLSRQCPTNARRLTGLSSQAWATKYAVLLRGAMANSSSEMERKHSCCGCRLIIGPVATWM